MTAELAAFGRVEVERGEKPEAGKVRLYLLQRYAGKRHKAATIYINGVETFSALWMDATSDKLGNAIWHNLKRSCRLS
ncbi:MAG: hypothetical protein JO335_09045 [Sphingomonas sp.]|nr:hypothetical protein [Sphingomonas sp.]